MAAPNFNGNISAGGNPWFDVKFYGAKGDGSTDDTTAVTNAINAAISAGSGTVFFPFGIYKVSSLPSITSSKVGLLGADKWGSVIQITATNGSGPSFAGTSGTPIKNNFLREITVQSASPGNGTGLSLSYAQVCILQNVQIADFVTGVSQSNSPNLLATNVLASYGGTGAFQGFAIDGTGVGNVSSIYRDCAVGATSSVAATSIGASIYSSTANGNCGDLNFFNFNTSYVATGMKFNFANAKAYSDCSSDIIIRDGVFDLFNAYGVQVLGGDNASLVKIEGGFFNILTTGSTDVIGVYSSARGTILQGAEFYPVATSFAHNAYATQMAGNDAVIQGCSFNGWKRGAYVNGGSNVTINGNRFYATPDGGSGIGIAMDCVELFNCANVSVGGNVFSGSAANGIDVGIYIDSTATGTAVYGNTFDTAHMTTGQIVLNSSTSSRIFGNIGYNPVGKLASQPAVPASGTAYTNSSGVDCTVNIFTGAGVTVSTLSIGGQATSLTMAASSQLSVLVPAAQTITLTYAGGTPAWSWFGN